MRPSSEHVLADLHIHTTASDGRFTPAECVAKAAALGLWAVAVTDHDTMDGAAEAVAAAGDAAGVSVIPGIEFGCHWNNRPDIEVHILGYGCDRANAELAAELSKLRSARSDRAGAMVQKLAGLGTTITVADVLKYAGDGVVGRPHIALALLEHGYASSVADAFDRFLSPGKPGYVEHYRPSPRRAIDLVHLAGGISVLAHPGLVGNPGAVASIISDGVRGLEVWHPQHSPEDCRRYLRLADERGLLATGGSDFHGIGDEGAPLGSCGVPADRLDALLTALSLHKAS